MGKKEESAQRELPYVKHEGRHWRVYYYPIDHFELDISKLGSFLEELEDRGEQVLAIVPNIGFVMASLVLSGFQGVKGFAIIARKPES